MSCIHLTPFAHLTDEEYLSQLYSKKDPTAYDLESAMRIELLLNAYRSLLEQIHAAAESGITNGTAQETLVQLRDITAPAMEAATVQ